MNKFETLMKEYGSSHTHPTNLLIHKFCVPLILLSIMAFLYAISVWLLLGAVILVFGYYYYLNKRYAVSFIPIFGLFGLISYGIGLVTNIYYVSASIFLISWIFQFIGHHIEGKRPSFMKDLQFLLIGPLWVYDEIFCSKR